MNGGESNLKIALQDGAIHLVDRNVKLQPNAALAMAISGDGCVDGALHDD